MTGRKVSSYDSRMARDAVFLIINDVEYSIDGPETGLMLADFLRTRVRLTGTKVVCAEGDCGACTVLRYFPYQDGVFEPINSCITTVAQMDGSALYSIEALRQSPIQRAMVECHGSQCGFCTPGFVMALSGLAEKKAGAKHLTEKQAKNGLTGNLCRCTGYKQILDAACSVDLSKYQSFTQSFAAKAKLKKTVAEPLVLYAGNFSFFAPVNARAAASLLAKNKKARLIGAGTDLGVARNKNKLRFEQLLSLHLIPELYQIKKVKNRWRVGARVTLAQLRAQVEDSIPELASFLDLFASPQIKNSATLVGNVANASPIADTPPFLLVTQAVVQVIGPRGARDIPVLDFFKSYRKTALKADEFITHIEFDIPKAQERLSLRKASQRKDLDISCVNAAFRAATENKKVISVALALGGVAPVPLRLRKTEKLLLNQNLDARLVERLCASLQAEITPITDLRGTSAFRRVLAENFFREFLESLS